jgi:hypothetical protein
MNLELSDEQAALLEKELTAIIEGDRYFLSPRIQILREIRNMIRPRARSMAFARTFALACNQRREFATA